MKQSFVALCLLSCFLHSAKPSAYRRSLENERSLKRVSGIFASARDDEMTPPMAAMATLPLFAFVERGVEALRRAVKSTSKRNQ